MSSVSPASSAARPRFRQPCAEDLCVATPFVTTDHTNQDVLEVFTEHRELATLPVTENDRPIGLINRSIFLSQMSKPYHRELYNRKSCIAFMDKDPLIVDAAMSIEALTFRTVEYGEKALTDGFIIASEGRFLGVGHGLQLMRVVADIQAERNRQIMHSIDYASIIQRAMLRASRDALAHTLPDASLVWEPRDVVGGDFYHFVAFEDGWFAALADCTGHGVPGAFMTLIASSLLTQAIEQQGPRDPGALLAAVHRGIKQMLGQADGTDAMTAESNDGMDAAFFWFDNATRRLTFAGARCALFVMHPGEADDHVIDGERKGVGYIDTAIDYAWANRHVDTQAGTVVFVTTDGLIDQIGGPKEIAFGKRRVREALRAGRDLPTPALSQAVLDAHLAWQGDNRRRDDLTYFCFRVR
ncbi:SpoIIE family protein phosphatase [Cupriavidus plantarum]|uniref:SpoIIE family protein phosphatase n=1 Tax=Cupriavidus plantarum TaxID=942865 RepID=UPI000E23FA56|nr:SpoIIE family protein phosphatase [Cupriavidus plantarum]REF02443.1 serine phosphatase RsbU (regulator of sigma subunit) [Cupriavidus plantarum]